ncbi:hypothetical protein HAX54_045779, partial [Datura stramonium]|nr:hypothetical protein [Datura stramonium]
MVGFIDWRKVKNLSGVEEVVGVKKVENMVYCCRKLGVLGSRKKDVGSWVSL